jgi:hypothetical protein
LGEIEATLGAARFSGSSGGGIPAVAVELGRLAWVGGLKDGLPPRWVRHSIVLCRSTRANAAAVVTRI